jgi:hypothetical protein
MLCTESNLSKFGALVSAGLQVVVLISVVGSVVATKNRTKRVKYGKTRSAGSVGGSDEDFVPVKPKRMKSFWIGKKR